MAKSFVGNTESEKFVNSIREKYGANSSLAKLVSGLTELQARLEAENDTRNAM